jgi:hypothetical protein
MIDGVFLLCEEGELVARDEYTGREMWRRAHGLTDTVCGPGCVLMRYLEVILRIDPVTGKELGAYEPPFPDAHWMAMAATEDGKTMYLVAGNKNGQGENWRATMAVNVADGNVLWTLGGPGKGTQRGGWSAIGDGIHLCAWGSRDRRTASRRSAGRDADIFTNARRGTTKEV